MSSISVSFKVDARVLDEIRRNLPENIERFLNEEAEMMVNDIKLSFGASPSSPGEPPGIDIGNLFNSMRWEPKGRYTRWIEDGTEYGLYLEWGTTTMAPRPFIGPAFERESLAIGDHAKQAGLVK